MDNKLGQRIKDRRKELGISAEYLAEKLDVSYTTIYRYESSSIEKIPVDKFDKLCKALSTTPAALMGNSTSKKIKVPKTFDNPQDAIEFLIKQPVLAEYGGYDPKQMTDEKILEFANEILHHLQILSYKYKKEDADK